MAKKYIILNVTDELLASPEEFTKAQAEKFVKEFPLRYKAQGYYRTAKREKIQPEEVILEILPSGTNIFDYLNGE